jgi:beta-phosphoglucomutase-like phosphatase (HAD superfamily)
MQQKAFIFDLNGTMINDMDFHIRAWHTILTSLGAELSLEQVKLECYGKNEELLERILCLLATQQVALIHLMVKEKRDYYNIEEILEKKWIPSL